MKKLAVGLCLVLALGLATVELEAAHRYRRGGCDLRHPGYYFQSLGHRHHGRYGRSHFRRYHRGHRGSYRRPQRYDERHRYRPGRQRRGFHFGFGYRRGFPRHQRYHYRGRPGIHLHLDF